MTLNEMQNAGVEFQSEIRLCYYDYDKDERVKADWVKDPGLYESCCNAEIRYIYTDKENEENGELVIYIEVRNPFED